MKTYSVAIIGLGRIASLLEDDPLRKKPCTHMGAYQSLKKRVKVIAGCDQDPGRRKLFRKRWGVENLYEKYEDLFNNEKPEIVSVCTWTDSHHEIVLRAAESESIKAIICEKPIALDVSLGKKMVDVCRKRGKLLLINHERRFEDRYRTIKQWIEAGKIGEIRTIIGHVLTAVPLKQKSFNINQTSLLHDGTHLVDIIQYLAGDIVSVRGFMDSHCREAITAVLKLKNGASVFLEAGGLRDYFDFELDIQGKNGRVLIGNTKMKLFTSAESVHYKGFKDLKEIQMPSFPRSNYFKSEISSLLDFLDGKSRTITSTGEDGLKTLKVIESVFTSIKKKSSRVKIC